jgi:hypothetical protein
VIYVWTAAIADRSERCDRRPNQAASAVYSGGTPCAFACK